MSNYGTALLKPLASGVSIPATPAVKIVDCFKVGDGVYAYRDSDFDRLLPKEIPAVSAGNASTFKFAKELNFQEMAEAHLGITGSHDELKGALIGQGKCFSPKQIDELIRLCGKGDNPLKLRTDGWLNLFPMQVGDDVFAVYAFRYSGGWDVYLRGFASADRWSARSRASLRN